jgi:serine phosphatase RsbU (regulator of sigma subunit)
VLGAFDFAEYRVSETQLASGDVVFTFSDGVTEAENASGDMFGESRLLELIQRSRDLTAEQIRERVMSELLNFTRGLPQGDDITVVALKVK